MQLSTRKVLDRSFSGLGAFSIVLMAGALLVLLLPIIVRGAGAFVFRATVEFRAVMMEEFSHGEPGRVDAEIELARQARRPLYDLSLIHI